MARTLLVRGMVVGAIAGVLALIFAKVFGEPPVSAAIAVESAKMQAAGIIEGPPVVSRQIQSTLGLGVAVIVYGTTIGGFFAIAYALVAGRIVAFGARTTAGLVALVGYGAVVFVPFIKYPANPPAVGHPDTIGHRSGLYFTMLVISLLLAIGMVSLGRMLVPRLGRWNATIAAVAAFVVTVGIAGYLMPTVDEVPAGFPADVLWQFRIASLGTQAVLWTSVGLLFGVLTDRALRQERRAAEAPVAAAAP
jgi:predicted cobalt transporter CbtA